MPITIPTPTNLGSAIIWCTPSVLSSLSANGLTARIKCTLSLATTPHPSAVASKRYINDSHTPRTLVKWWSKPLLPLITIIVVGITNRTCDVLKWFSIVAVMNVTQEKIVFNTQNKCHCDVIKQSAKHLLMWSCDMIIGKPENPLLTKILFFSMCLTGSPLKGRCDSPSNYKSSQACGCRPERKREPKSFRQLSLFLLTNSDYPLP